MTTSSVCGIISKEDIELLIEKANAHHPIIKFTAEVLQIETTLLDTNVCKGKRFEIDRRILNVRSLKPTTGVEKSLVKGEAFRLLGNYNTNYNIKGFKTGLISRGYTLGKWKKRLARIKEK